MRLLSRAEFLRQPAGVVYAKAEPCVFEDLCIKGESWPTDFWAVEGLGGCLAFDHEGQLMEAFDQMEAGHSWPMDFETETRDGLFDEDQLFAVFEAADVAALIARLQAALASGYQAPTGVG